MLPIPSAPQLGLRRWLAAATAATGLLAGCGAGTPLPSADAELERRTPTGQELRAVPAPEKPIPVAVYRFPDKTGQRKPTDEPYAAYSQAVTQGGAAILIDTLLKASEQNFFRVVERAQFDDVAQERKIIAQMRKRYGGGGAGDMGALTFAGLLLEGGITMYERNLVTGGLGARYFGIGAQTRYRRDAVTVHLRAVNVSTGEVVASIDASKTIYATEYRGDLLRFVTFDRQLELEGGITTNEPRQLAVQQAIEKAVYGLIMEGAEGGLWSFADDAAGKAALEAYRQSRGGSTRYLDELERGELAQPQRDASDRPQGRR